MVGTRKRVCRGYILAVQEYRFNFLSDEGQGLLLTLSRFAPIGPDKLSMWHNQKAHLQVEYIGEPNLVSGVAQKVEEIGNSY